jgi:hypothetical protein
VLAQQKTFSGGLDTISNNSQIPANRYEWLLNGRPRFGYVDPVKKSSLLGNVPEGNVQGGIGVGSVKIVFVAGAAYYQLDGSDEFVQIPNFQMSATAPKLWAQAVPSSTFNFKRKLSGSISSSLIQENLRISGTPAGIVVQDGQNQPWIIFEQDGAFYARATKTYAEWQNVSIVADDREYVPIGKQMMFLDGILYVVSTDGKRVYRSISYRPLDFMINVDPDGNKQSSEKSGGADSVSFACDYDTITCIAPVNIPNSFVYATATTVRIVTADYENTIFDEPRYRVSATIKSGIVNEESFIELIGDYAFVDSESVKSFDAVRQLQNEGRNSIFSIPLTSFLQPKQTKSAAIVFDSYALFALDTSMGPAICVYDLIIQCWVSIDLTEVGSVKQFFIITNETEDKLYAINTNNEVYQMYCLDTRETASIKLRSLMPEEVNVEHKTEYVRAVFDRCSYNGLAWIHEYVDEQESPENRCIEQLNASTPAVLYPVIGPVVPASTFRTNNPTFALIRGTTGKKISFILSWNNDSRLVELEAKTSEFQSDSAMHQKQSSYEATYGN